MSMIPFTAAHEILTAFSMFLPNASAWQDSASTPLLQKGSRTQSFVLGPDKTAHVPHAAWLQLKSEACESGAPNI